MAKALAIVQARMSSSRLPGKSGADVAGEPLLALLLKRLQRAGEIGRIVVATSGEPEDDRVVEIAKSTGSTVYRGPLDDVLTRFVGAAASHLGPVVRITADCPLIDPEVVDGVIELFQQTPGCEYASNIEPRRTFPVGLDTEVFSRGILEELSAEVTDPDDREHVTIALRRDLGRFRTAALVCQEELGDLRWTVDTEEDLAYLRSVVARLGTRRYEAGFREILAAIREEPALIHGLDRGAER